MRRAAGAGGVRGDDAADRLYGEHREFARRCLAELETEVPWLTDLTWEDREDLLQETEVALWVACRRYARHGPAGMSGQSFTEFARVHLRGYLKAYISRWWCDPDFSLLPNLDDLWCEALWEQWPER